MYFKPLNQDQEETSQIYGSGMFRRYGKNGTSPIYGTSEIFQTFGTVISETFRACGRKELIFTNILKDLQMFSTNDYIFNFCLLFSNLIAQINVRL